MTRKELYISMLQEIINRLPDGEEKSDLQDSLALEKFDDVCCDIIPLLATSTSYLINFIQNNLNDLDEDITDGNAFSIETVSSHRKIHMHSFISITEDFIILPTCYLYDNRDKTTDSTLWRSIECIWQHIEDDTNEIDRFLTFLDVRNEENYYYINKASLSCDAWKVYSAAYMSHVTCESPQIPKELQFADSPLFSTPITYHWNSNYEQYHDIYNIITEMRAAKDVLTRFLKMYQVLELMTYRYLLVPFANGQITRNSFISNVKKLSNEIGQNEKASLKKALKTIMPNIHNDDISSFVTIPLRRLHKLSNYLQHNYQCAYSNVYGTSLETNSVEKIANLIYTLRCSIVHSKESELHFTFGNIAEYKDIVPMMGLLIQVIERKIVEVLNADISEPLDFKDEKMGLY